MQTGVVVQVRLLGPVDVALDGRSRPVNGLRRKAVLAALALHDGEVVSTDRLVDVVWGESAPPTVVNSLQPHISYRCADFWMRSGCRRPVSRTEYRPRPRCTAA